VVDVDGHERTIPAAKQRTVLATLLLSPNHIVPVDRIATAIWGDEPPPTATATIRTYVMRLRQFLGPGAGHRISTRAPGYLISLRDDETDLGRFHAHRARAAGASDRGDLEAAAAELLAALGLWRHDPLLDVHSPLKDSQVRHLRELRLQTQNWRIDLQLTLRRPAEILPELCKLAREDPLNEALAARQMRALSLAGRPAEAFDVYHQTRALLVERLGVEPSSELRNTLQSLLRAQDPPARLTLAGPGADLSDRPALRPAQLPAAALDLTSRVPESAILGRYLTCGPPTTVISGAAGAGKSFLAVHVAHKLAARFPGGQLYADLTGPGGCPVPVTDVLRHFISSLGVGSLDLPWYEPGPEPGLGLVALYRSLIANRNVLVLLDGAQSAAQVRPLVPGTGASRVLVTSRTPLPDLDGAQRLPLMPLDEATGLELLSVVAGHERVRREPAAARRVVADCSGLALALRIAGARLASRPHWTIETLANRLADPARQLGELRIGDLNVRHGLEAARARLGLRTVAGIDVQAAWRLLALGRPGPVDPVATAVRLDCSAEQARELLDILVDAYLLDGPPYRVTPLQHSFCRGLGHEIRRPGPTEDAVTGDRAKEARIPKP
jgi:DNA-binding SARP family transcriptional activator